MEQKNISFGKGIHRSPSLAVETGELSECVNLIPRGGELVNIDPPVEGVSVASGERINVVIPNTAILLCVHHVGDMDHYIYQYADGRVGYISSDAPTEQMPIGEYSAIKGMQPMGNTLTMIFKSDPMQWLIWDPEQCLYSELGDFPKVDIAFTLENLYQSSSDNVIDDIAVAYTTGEDEDTYTQLIYKVSPTSVNYGDSVIGLSEYTYGDLKRGLLVSIGGETIRFKVRNTSDKPIRVYELFTNSITGEFRSSTYEIVMPGDKSRHVFSYFDADTLDDSRIFAVMPDGDSVEDESGVDIFHVSVSDWGTWNYGFELCAEVLPDDRFYTIWKPSEDTIKAIKASMDLDLRPGRFNHIFFVRYGFRMYNNSLINVSSPVIMMPSCYYTNALRISGAYFHDGEGVYHGNLRCGQAMSADLCMTIRSITGFKDTWKNIIKGIDIFVSEQALPYDLSAPPSFTVVSGKELSSMKYMYSIADNAWTLGIDYQNDEIKVPGATFFNLAPKQGYEDIVANKAALCYKYRSFSMSQIMDLVNIKTKLEYSGNDIRTLPTQELLQEGSTSFAPRLYPEIITAYNSRIVTANVSMEESMPPSIITPEIDATLKGKTLDIVVFRRDNEDSAIVGDWVKAKINYAKFVFYPNRDAKKIIRFFDDGRVLEFDLRPHGLLNGAYYISLYEDKEPQPIALDEMESRIQYYREREYHRTEHNAIYNSAVNNPFLFSLDQSQTVGSGDIRAITTAGKALSSGSAFGQQPLYCFCTDGVWPLEVNEKGEFEPSNPATRDIITSHDAVTQMDGLIIFAANDGLRMMSGEQSILLSDVLKGYNVSESEFFKGMPDEWSRLSVDSTRSIVEILHDCFIVPDYAHRRLHVYPKTQEASDTGLHKHYVFAIDDKEWSTVVDEHSHIVSVVPGYPASIMQRADGQLIQFTTDEDNDTYRDGILLTRPIAFDEPNALKVIADLRILYTQMGDSKCTIQMFVSNDGANWMPLNSLRKHAYKWYRFRIRTHLKDTDALTALTVLTETRRTNKLR